MRAAAITASIVVLSACDGAPPAVPDGGSVLSIVPELIGDVDPAYGVLEVHEGECPSALDETPEGALVLWHRFPRMPSDFAPEPSTPLDPGAPYCARVYAIDATRPAFSTAECTIVAAGQRTLTPGDDREARIAVEPPEDEVALNRARAAQVCPPRPMSPFHGETLGFVRETRCEPPCPQNPELTVSRMSWPDEHHYCVAMRRDTETRVAELTSLEPSGPVRGFWSGEPIGRYLQNERWDWQVRACASDVGCDVQLLQRGANRCTEWSSPRSVIVGTTTIASDATPDFAVGSPLAGLVHLFTGAVGCGSERDCVTLCGIPYRLRAPLSLPSEFGTSNECSREVIETVDSSMFGAGLAIRPTPLGAGGGLAVSVANCRDADTDHVVLMDFPGGAAPGTRIPHPASVDAIEAFGLSMTVTAGLPDGPRLPATLWTWNLDTVMNTIGLFRSEDGAPFTRVGPVNDHAMIWGRGDLDGDAYVDVLTGSEIFRGPDYESARRIQLDTDAELVGRVEVVPDSNGDGVDELLVSARPTLGGCAARDEITLRQLDSSSPETGPVRDLATLGPRQLPCPRALFSDTEGITTIGPTAWNAATAVAVFTDFTAGRVSLRYQALESGGPEGEISLPGEWTCNWLLLRRGDFDADGRADLLVIEPGNGELGVVCGHEDSPRVDVVERRDASMERLQLSPSTASNRCVRDWSAAL